MPVRSNDASTSRPTPLFNSYRAGDGRWFFLVGVEAQRHLPTLLGAIGRPDLLARFPDGRSAARHRVELIALLDGVFASQPLAHWAREFDARDVWWAPIQTPAEVLDDPQARATGAWVSVDRGAQTPVESVDSPIRYDGRSRTVLPHAPGVGEHTEEILGSLTADAQR
jgi:crotonobetainyl-CoA:carnitine CoA-transferase CaiB-like acyl-CoA transferase